MFCFCFCCFIFNYNIYVCILLLTHIHTYTCMYMCSYINCNYHTHPPQLTNGQTHTHARTHIATDVGKDERIFQTKEETLLIVEFLLSGTLPFAAAAAVARGSPTLQTFVLLSCYFYFLFYNTIQFKSIFKHFYDTTWTFEIPSALSLRFISYFIILNNSLFKGFVMTDFGWEGRLGRIALSDRFWPLGPLRDILKGWLRETRNMYVRGVAFYSVLIIPCFVCDFYLLLVWLNGFF